MGIFFGEAKKRARDPRACTSGPLDARVQTGIISPASAPCPPPLTRRADSAAQVQTFSSNAFKFWLSGGNSGRQLDNYPPSPRGAAPPLTELEGKRLLPSGGRRGCLPRGEMAGGVCGGRGLGRCKCQRASLCCVVSCSPKCWQHRQAAQNWTYVDGELWGGFRGCQQNITLPDFCLTSCWLCLFG